MSYEVKVEHKENDYGDWRGYMTISHDGVVLERYCDGGEPEDNSFGRDWSWVKKELVRAYELGKKDASGGQ